MSLELLCDLFYSIYTVMKYEIEFVIGCRVDETRQFIRESLVALQKIIEKQSPSNKVYLIKMKDKQQHTKHSQTQD